MRIDINYSVEKMEKSRKRMEARGNYKYYDRAPVIFCLSPRYFTRVFGIEYNEIFKDAKTQFHWQLQIAKYRAEQVGDDFLTSPIVYVHPYFDNVVPSSAFGSDIHWVYNETPQAVPTMNDPSDIDKFRIPEPTEALWGKVIDWWGEMQEYAKDTELWFGDTKGEVKVAGLSLNGIGPHMIAIDLAGTNFYWWMVEYPKQCHKLLDGITTGMANAEHHLRKIDPVPRAAYGLAEDSAQIMSPEMFKEFVVPYDLRLYDEFAGGENDPRSMHMCGDSTHLHESLVNDLRISDFQLFGFAVSPEVAAKNLGGKTRLWGNINPMLIKDGTPGEIKAAAFNALDALIPCGGFLLSDGANICPGTSLENLAAMIEAAEEHAREHPQYYNNI